MIEGGGGYRCTVWTVPTPFLCLPDPLEKMRDLNSGSYLCMSLSLPLNHIRSYMEFVSRLKLIFEHFRKPNLYLKASKCFFGYSELEFVGKVVSEKGLQISRTKIQSILDFPLPTVSKQLKSFLGTANYLRDFVRDYSTISKPLHQLLIDYNKTRKVVWTPESTAAFHEGK